METVDEHLVISSSIDDVKTQIHEVKPTDNADLNVCHKSNGVDSTSSVEIIVESVEENNILDPEPKDIVLQKPIEEMPESGDNNSEPARKVNIGITDSFNIIDNDGSEGSKSLAVSGEQTEEKPEKPVEVMNEVSSKDMESNIEQPSVTNENIVPSLDCKNVENEVLSSMVEVEDHEEKGNSGNLVLNSTTELCNVEYTTLINEGIHFETEVLIEKNDNDGNENIVQTEICCNEAVSGSHNNILSELEENIELSEVLQSSDINDTSENNNSTVKVEVFNKEELLDILEGKDVPDLQTEEIVKENTEIMSSDQEVQQALKQITMLKKIRKRRTPRNEQQIYIKQLKKPVKENFENKEDSIKTDVDAGIKRNTPKNKEKDNLKTSIENLKDTKSELVVLPKRSATKSKEKEKVIENIAVEKEEPKNEVTVESHAEKDKNIVNELVMDWDDDEQPETNSIVPKAEKSDLVNEKEIELENLENNAEQTSQSSVDCLVTEEQLHSKSIEDCTGKRRLSRVIKKKVIYDPDNPDTFTKSKTPLKSLSGKEQPSLKKGKLEMPILEQRKSRSPSSKLQWKKPSPRNSKQHKRLTEVDKLLMDEGAVNMIYQLTPEASKGRKNVKTKAEFIKKLQSSTPDGKEMKFRERKKELKYEEGEAKKLSGGKYRPSLSNSVKSPAASDDFETHSADDSIIYRRHSSSSYSSSCMSPRRLSDVEGSQNTKQTKIEAQTLNNKKMNESQDQSQESTFLSDVNLTLIEEKSDLINKEDCLSLKEKLNSKLSLALNKRKRESTTLDKPTKQKKLKPEGTNLSEKENSDMFKFVSVKIEQHLAEICLKKTGLKDSIEVFNEIKKALLHIDENPDVAVTLLSSQCGTLCSNLDLSILLDENSEIRHKNAYNLAESVRALLSAASGHSKLLCCGVWGACSGPAVSLVSLCDLALASECATFALAVPAAPPLPGAAAIVAPHRGLPQSLVSDLVVLGRRISASEALNGGLISRTLWPDRFDEQVRNIVRDIALEPPNGTLLKKRLLTLRKCGGAEQSFLTSLESERDLLVTYWTSEEGQALLRAALDAA
ncbi:uncharacterized protein LOC110992130 [Pieris rapae]|uniref:uncharacterized protein LOC110992130 n=1 Tax=Pieris rapae TaxID=64459 RepID=UPI001E2818DF|nr:uncharacterized protein LOC110992130 [Pieris rapae]